MMLTKFGVIRVWVTTPLAIGALGIAIPFGRGASYPM